MTAAYRLKGLGWFAACVGAVLAFYLVSLQVAAERKKLDMVNSRIRAAERDVRALETEFDTRANLAQLERWNGDTLALTAPTAGQFVADEAALAQIGFGAAPGEVETRSAAFVVPSLPLPVQAVPAQAPAQSGEATPVIAPAVVVEPIQRDAPTIVRVAATQPVRAAPKPVMIRASATATARVAKPQMAMLDRKLLSDTTFGDIVSGARAESARRR